EVHDSLHVAGSGANRRIDFILLGQDDLNTKLQCVIPDGFRGIVSEGVGRVGLVIWLKGRIDSKAVATVGGVRAANHEPGNLATEAGRVVGGRESFWAKKEVSRGQVRRAHEGGTGPVHIGEGDVVRCVTENKIVYKRGGNDLSYLGHHVEAGTDKLRLHG